MNSKVLVTGGAGRAGETMCKALAELGTNLVILDSK